MCIHICTWDEQIGQSIHKRVCISKVFQRKRKQKSSEPSLWRFRNAIKVQRGTKLDIVTPLVPPAMHVAYRHCSLRDINVMRRCTALACLLCLTARLPRTRVAELQSLRWRSPWSAPLSICWLSLHNLPHGVCHLLLNNSQLASPCCASALRLSARDVSCYHQVLCFFDHRDLLHPIALVDWVFVCVCVCVWRTVE